MDREYLKRRVEGLKKANPDIQKMQEEIKYHACHTAPDAYKASPGRNVLICIEELVECAEVLIFDKSCSYRIGVLEELADVDLSAASMRAELGIQNVPMASMEIPVRAGRGTADGMPRKCLCMVNRLSKLIRKGVPATEKEKWSLANELAGLMCMCRAAADGFSITGEELVYAEYVKCRTFVEKLYEDGCYVPQRFFVNGHAIEFGSRTAVGEPAAWISLPDRTSIEVVQEWPPGVPYFSIRRHCSEEDFENGAYHDTCGVISTDTARNMLEVEEILGKMLPG